MTSVLGTQVSMKKKKGVNFVWAWIVFHESKKSRPNSTHLRNATRLLSPTLYCFLLIQKETQKQKTSQFVVECKIHSVVAIPVGDDRCSPPGYESILLNYQVTSQSNHSNFLFQLLSYIISSFVPSKFKSLILSLCFPFKFNCNLMF